MQELGKFNIKTNVMPNGLEKYMSFSINNKLRFIDSFQFLSSSLNSLVENLGKDDFKYLRILPYEYMTDFKRFKEQLPTKEKFYSSLTGKKINLEGLEQI